MTKTNRTRSLLAAVVAASGSLLLLGAAPPPKGKATTAATGAHETHSTATAATRPDSGASLTAELVDPQAKAREKEATVRVKVAGIRLIDPEIMKEKPRKGQGHLHYQVDNGPVVATTATKLSFHELASGTHSIKVVLAANDHSPLGPEQTLSVRIP